MRKISILFAVMLLTGCTYYPYYGYTTGGYSTTEVKRYYDPNYNVGATTTIVTTPAPMVVSPPVVISPSIVIGGPRWRGHYWGHRRYCGGYRCW